MVMMVTDESMWKYLGNARCKPIQGGIYAYHTDLALIERSGNSQCIIIADGPETHGILICISVSAIVRTEVIASSERPCFYVPVVYSRC